jgi:hypothetical protein
LQHSRTLLLLAQALQYGSKVVTSGALAGQQSASAQDLSCDAAAHRQQHTFIN